MLAPTKHTKIRYSVLYIAGLILFEIKKNGIIKYDDLKNVIINAVDKEIGDSFTYSLSYLFLIGKIFYNQELDSFRLAES